MSAVSRSRLAAVSRCHHVDVLVVLLLTLAVAGLGGTTAQQLAVDEQPPLSSSNATTDNSVRDEESAPYIPPGGHVCNPVARECRDGMVLPAWLPIQNISALDKAGRAIVYMLALFYLFLGVSIIADRFMAAIEVITSTEKEVTILRCAAVL